MIRIVRACLVALLCLAVLVPPRLHASATDHSRHGPAPAAMAMPDHHHDHGCDPAPAPSGMTAGFSADMCLSACACLPAVPQPLAISRVSGAGEKLVPPIAGVAGRGETGGPFRPPRNHS